MIRRITVKRLNIAQDRLRTAKEGLAVLEAQFAVWKDAVDDLQTRALVSASPESRAEYTELLKHVAATKAALERQALEIQRLTDHRDTLLRQWVPKEK